MAKFFSFFLSLPIGYRIRFFYKFLFCCPFIFVYMFLCNRTKELLLGDLCSRFQSKDYVNPDFPLFSLIMTMLIEKEFRNVVYMRIHRWAFLTNMLLPQLPNIMLGDSHNIGKGFNLIHGYSTVINGSTIIGENCTVMHNVTIGVANKGCPCIGDNVFIGAGAIIIGNVKIGSNSKIGAGAIVVKDVPSNTTAINPTAHLVIK